MKNLIMLLALLVGSVPAKALQSGSEVLFSKTAQGVSFNKDVEAGSFERFSIQLDYADAAPATPTVTDGAFSSMTLTVKDYTLLVGRASSATITLVAGKNPNTDGTIVTVKGTPFAEGSQWTYDAIYATQTAKNLQVAIDAHHGYSATVSSNVITVTANDKGTAANSWTVAATGTGVWSLTTFAMGQAHGYLNFNGTTLTEGTDWTAATSSAATANSLAVAINANATISALVAVSSASAPGDLTDGMLTLTSKLSGANRYYASVSNTAGLRYDYPEAFGGAASDISVAGNTFAETAHGLGEGLAVRLDVTAGTAPTGLTDQTTYFIKVVSADSFQVTLTSVTTTLGAAVDITAVTGAGSFNFVPLTFASAASDGIKFQGSNDGTTFYDLTTSSVPYEGTDGGVLRTFTDYAYKYMRMAFVAPTAGGLNLNAVLNWQK